MKPSQEEFNQARKYLPSPLNFKRGDRCWVCTPEWLYQFSLSVKTNSEHPAWEKITRSWKSRIVIKRLKNHYGIPTLGTMITNIPRSMNKIWMEDIDPS